MTDEDFLFYRPIVFHLYVTGYTYEQAFLHIRGIYGGLTPELPAIKKWFSAITHSTFSFQQNRIEGRHPITNICERIKEVLKHHPNASTKFIAEMFSLSRGTIKHRLIHDLKMKRYKLRWIPHELNDGQKAQRRMRATLIKAALERHKDTEYSNLVTGDESWFFLTIIATQCGSRKAQIVQPQQNG
jgi:hypothetical protein